MDTKGANIGMNVSKQPAVARFFSTRPRKIRAKSTRQVLPTVEPWMNYAGQVELPSKRWLKSAEPNE